MPSPIEPSSSSSLLSLIIPTFNEAANIGVLLDRLAVLLRDIPHELIVVDDHSPDGTANAVKTHAQHHANVRLIERVGQRGLSSAVLMGLDAAHGDVLGVMDADLSHDESTLLPLLTAIKNGNELAVGSRRLPGGGATDWPWYRRLMSSFATFVAQAALSLPLTDPMSGFFLMRRELFVRARPLVAPMGYKILLSLFCAGKPQHLEEVPYIFRTRKQGHSKVSMRVLREFAVMLWVERRILFNTPARCPFCSRSILRARFIKDFNPLYSCPSCDLLFVGSSFAIKPAQRVYGAHYYEWIKNDESFAREIKRATFRRWLKETGLPPGRLLDIGCAYGFLMDEASAQGWQVWGIEISDHARAKAQRAWKDRVVSNLDALPPHTIFDLLTLCDVIEHFYDPLAFLPKLHTFLEPRGVILFTTPDWSSAWARLMGKYWFHVKPDEHPLLMSRKAFASLLHTQGFDVIHIRRAFKQMTFSYMARQFATYRFPFHFAIAPFFRFLAWIVRDRSFSIYSGEMLVLARKSPANA